MKDKKKIDYLRERQDIGAYLKAAKEAIANAIDPDSLLTLKSYDEDKAYVKTSLNFVTDTFNNNYAEAEVLGGNLRDWGFKNEQDEKCPDEIYNPAQEMYQAIRKEYAFVMVAISGYHALLSEQERIKEESIKNNQPLSPDVLDEMKKSRECYRNQMILQGVHPDIVDINNTVGPDASRQDLQNNLEESKNATMMYYVNKAKTALAPAMKSFLGDELYAKREAQLQAVFMDTFSESKVVTSMPKITVVNNPSPFLRTLAEADALGTNHIAKQEEPVDPAREKVKTSLQNSYAYQVASDGKIEVKPVPNGFFAKIAYYISRSWNKTAVDTYNAPLIAEDQKLEELTAQDNQKMEELKAEADSICKSAESLLPKEEAPTKEEAPVNENDALMQQLGETISQENGPVEEIPDEPTQSAPTTEKEQEQIELDAMD